MRRRSTGDRRRLARLVAALDDVALDVALQAALAGDLAVFEERAARVAGRIAERVVRCGGCGRRFPASTRRLRCERCGRVTWRATFARAA